MNVVEAKNVIKTAYVLGEISDDVYNAMEVIINEYEDVISSYNKPRPWTVDEEKLLLKLRFKKGYSPEKISPILNRTVSAIEKRLRLLTSDK